MFATAPAVLSQNPHFVPSSSKYVSYESYYVLPGKVLVIFRLKSLIYSQREVLSPLPDERYCGSSMCEVAAKGPNGDELPQ